MLKAIPDLIAEAANNVRRITAEEAKGELAGNNGLLVDVREPAEYEAGAAKEAVNFPRGQLEMKMVEFEKDADRPIYLYCRSGARATLAVEQLNRVGYNNVTCVSSPQDQVRAVFGEA